MHFENSYNILFLYMQQFPQDKNQNKSQTYQVDIFAYISIKFKCLFLSLHFFQFYLFISLLMNGDKSIFHAYQSTALPPTCNTKNQLTVTCFFCLSLSYAIILISQKTNTLKLLTISLNFPYKWLVQIPYLLISKLLIYLYIFRNF